MVKNKKKLNFYGSTVTKSLSSIRNKWLFWFFKKPIHFDF